MAQKGSPETLRQPTVHYGMQLNRLSDEILHGVVAAYFDVVKGEPIEEHQLWSSYRALRVIEDGGAEFRLGSPLNQHSKLIVYDEGSGLVSYRFFANHQRLEDEYSSSHRWQTAIAIGETFRTRVDELLLVAGLAEPIPSQ